MPFSSISRFMLMPSRSAISERVSPGFTVIVPARAGSGSTRARARAARERRMGTRTGNGGTLRVPQGIAQPPLRMNLPEWGLDAAALQNG